MAARKLRSWQRARSQKLSRFAVLRCQTRLQTLSSSNRGGECKCPPLVLAFDLDDDGRWRPLLHGYRNRAIGDAADRRPPARDLEEAGPIEDAIDAQHALGFADTRALREIDRNGVAAACGVRLESSQIGAGR